MIGIIPPIREMIVPKECDKRPGYKLNATTLTIHNTASPNAPAINLYKYLVSPSNKRIASWHYTVDWKEAILTIPENEVAWHAGTRDGNYSSLSIEVCEGDKYWKDIYPRAVGLSAYILAKRGWGVDRLRKHQDWSGKYCPHLIIPIWKQFVADVQETLDHIKGTPSDSSTKTGIITAKSLNVRTGVGTKNPVIRTLVKGAIVKIYEESNNWYRIGNSEWISASYVDLFAPKEATETPIMGTQVLTADQLYGLVKAKNKNPKIDVSLYEFCKMFLEEGAAEGVRGDIAFCQSIKETGAFNYGGQVLPEQHNYAGIGATNNSPVGKGAWFKDAREGIRAQIQHLKAYASKDALVNPCVDPRFSLVTRGIAQDWEDLNGKWAVPGPNYGEEILKIYEEGKKFDKVIPELHKAAVVEAAEWQKDPIRYLYEKRIISDEGWVEKALEDAPVWTVTMLIGNLYKVLTDERVPAKDANWKMNGLNVLADAKIILDKQGWATKLDEAMPVWGTATILTGLLKEILPVIEIKTSKDWKVNSLTYLNKSGILDDLEGWSKKKDEATPVWALCIMLVNAHKKIVNEIGGE